MTTATKIRSKLNTNKSKSTISNTVHWIINKELKQYETDLMEQLNFLDFLHIVLVKER